MKRSEAKKLIKEIMQNRHNLQTYDRVADKILSALEEAGILPPHTKVINCNCYDHNWEPESSEELLDAEKMLADAIAEIQEIQARRPADEKTKRLLEAISTPEHLAKMYKAGHKER